MNYLKRIILYLFYFFLLSYILGLCISGINGANPPESLIIICFASVITGFFLIIVALLNISEEVRELNEKINEMKKENKREE